jgi:hypothetical protein
MLTSSVIAQKTLKWTMYGVIIAFLSLIATLLLHDKVARLFNSLLYKQPSIGGTYESQTSGKRYEIVPSPSGDHVDLFLLTDDGKKILVGSGPIKDNDPTSLGDEVIIIQMQVDLSNGTKRTAVLELKPSPDGNTLAGNFKGSHKQETGRLFFFRLVAG